MRATDRTQSHLTRAKNWIVWVKNHRDIVVRSVLAIVGVYLVINGTRRTCIELTSTPTMTIRIC
jgi:hypothetical protein